MQLLADLHIHTVLSPCAAPEMTPTAIVQEAIDKRIAMVAICDHNSAGNTAATQRAAGDRLSVIAGIEITTREEVHLVGLFPDARAARTVGDRVKATLPDLTDPPHWMGEQKLMSSRSRVLGIEPKMLHAASTFSLEQAVDLIHEHGGLAIAAHLDRPSFSVLSQLGMLPEGLALDAIEVSPAGVKKGSQHSLATHGFTVVCSSDAHSLEEIGDGQTLLEVETATFQELAKALAARDGRRCCVA